MINPTENDIGRKVIYCGYAGEREDGIVTSFNDAFVFVRYGSGTTSAATKREQLEWLSGRDNRVFIHTTPRADACEHDFQGWREFDDGRGGEQVCTKCGMGAMTYSLSVGP